MTSNKKDLRRMVAKQRANLRTNSVRLESALSAALEDYHQCLERVIFELLEPEETSQNNQEKISTEPKA